MAALAAMSVTSSAAVAGGCASSRGVWRRAAVVASLAISPALLAGYADTAAADWSEPVGLSGAHAVTPDIAVDLAGDATVVWSRRGGAGQVVEGRRISAAGASGPVQSLTAPGSEGIEPDVAVGPLGGGIVAWSRLGGPRTESEARMISASGELGLFRGLSLAASGTQVAVDARGVAIASGCTTTGRTMSSRGAGSPPPARSARRSTYRLLDAMPRSQGSPSPRTATRPRSGFATTAQIRSFRHGGSRPPARPGP